MAHTNGKFNGAAMTENREQIAFHYHQDGTSHRNAQVLPKVRIQQNRAVIQGEALRQAASEEADPSYTGHQAGLHPDNRPFQSSDLTLSRVGRRSESTNTPVTLDAEGEYDIEEDERYYGTRPPTSARRYQEYHVSPEHIVQRGNQRYHVRYVDIPKRQSRQQQLPSQQERQTEEYAIAPPRGNARPGRRLHPLAWIGIFLTLLILGWFGLNDITSWFQGVQNDWTYGKQRHFEINAVVGHSDSQTNPSHFTAENTNGEIIVIELPGGNVSKAKIYQIETVPNNTGNPPVKLSFQDMNGDGKPDMLVAIGDGSATLYITLWNNGSEFVSKL
jgi:hypothetical protein